MIYDKMLAEQNRIKAELNSIESKLTKFPKGKLICTKISKESTEHYKWYQSDGHTKSYIPKSNASLAQQLAAKKYLTTLKGELLQESRAIDFYLKHHNSSPSESSKLLTEHPEYSRLLSPFFTPLSKELLAWSQEPYQTNPEHPEHLIHHGAANHLLRSKSEAIIDLLLYTNKIPFRYECALSLGGIILYPDFTIIHPVTGKVYYWEHFGLMDKPSYRKKNYERLQLYSAHGIFPGDNLIITFETKDNPLSISLINQIIERYFL